MARIACEPARPEDAGAVARAVDAARASSVLFATPVVRVETVPVTASDLAAVPGFAALSINRGVPSGDATALSGTA